MRVAYIINDAAFFVSHRLHLALSVLDEGGNVIVITGRNVNKKLENKAINILKKNNIRHKCCLFSQGFKNPLFEIIGLVQVIFFLIFFKPTTVHSVTSKGNFMAIISLNFLKNVKLVMSVSGLGTMFTGKINLKKKFFLFIYRFTIKVFLSRLTYNIIFQNHDDFIQFQSLIKIKTTNIRFVPGSGVDTKYLIPVKLNYKQMNILLPARMLYEKGVNEFIEAIKILKKRNIKGKFFLAGDTMSMNPSRIPKEKINLWVKEGLVEYLGHQDDMKSLYKKMSIVCLPSWREGFPKVLMEAASCGIPTITTNVPGCRDAVVDQKTGILVPLKNSAALANAIQFLIENINIQKKMGASGRELALRKFDFRKINPMIIGLYR